MRYLPIKEKLILNYVVIGVCIISIIGFFSYYAAKKGILDRTFDQLTSLRYVKTAQIENYFNDRIRDAELLSNSKGILALSNKLNKFTINEVGNAEPLQLAKSTHYLIEYINTPGYYENIILQNRNGLALNLTNPVNRIIATNEKEDVLSDIWDMINPTGETQVKEIKNNIDQKVILIIEPVYDKYSKELKGIIILEISPKSINKIMQDEHSYDGFGESGESYIVGNDSLMRSDSRFLENSILNIKVNSPGVSYALNGIDSTAIFNDYRDIKVLSSFGSASIPGINWILLSEIDYKEAIIPISSIRDSILMISTLIALLLFIFAFYASNRITSPIIKLKDASLQIGQGNFNLQLKIKSNDEIGDLIDSFKKMTSRLKKMTHELKLERHRRLRSVIDGQEIERQRLSRELHDGIGQQLIALKLKLESTQGLDQCDTQKALKEVKEYFDQTIDEIRRISNNLMPAVLNEFGLVNALRNLVDQSSSHTEMDIKFSSKNVDENLNKKHKTYLYRIAQEAMNNAIKYSKAKKIKVFISKGNEYLTLRIEDDGEGFDYNKVYEGPGNGIKNMQERTALLNGVINISSGINSGTKIIVNIPV